MKLAEKRAIAREAQRITLDSIRDLRGTIAPEAYDKIMYDTYRNIKATLLERIEDGESKKTV